MFTHHELILLQTIERRLELEAEARQGGLAALRRWVERAGPGADPALHQFRRPPPPVARQRGRGVRPVAWLRAHPAESQPVDDRARP